MKSATSRFMHRHAIAVWSLSIGIGAGLLSGCAAGRGSQTNSQSSPVVSILTQPSSETVPIGRTATFSVVASGTGPLQYQWSENGAPIAGATSASYTTPVITLNNSGSTFQVTVSNATSSATSRTATLTSGPRAPALGDVRYLLFEQVTAAGLYQNGLGNTDVFGASSFWGQADAIGAPLTIGTASVCKPGIADDCTWTFHAYSLPAAQPYLVMSYESDNYAKFASDLQPSNPQGILAPSVVIDSLDFEPGNGLFALGYVQATQYLQQAGGFDYRLEVVSPDQLQTTVARDGAQSRVVTAVSFDANHQANVISYGWTGDSSTLYEGQTAIAHSASEITDQAEAMASEGYFLSAFGGNDSDGYMLIGMRVQGDTMARPIYVTTSNPSGSYSGDTLPQQNPPYATQIISGGFFGSGTNAPTQIDVSEE